MAVTEAQRQQRIEAARAAGDAHRARKAACQRIVEITRRQQDLPPEIADVEVLERLGALLEENGVEK
jgi:hypothetical protein